MSHGLRVGNPPSNPLMVYDGDCYFCGLWIRRWRQLTGDAVEYLPSQDPRIAGQYAEIPPEFFDSAVQLIETDGTVYSGAEAVFRSLAANPWWGWLLRLYRAFPPFAWLTERAYRVVADHRPVFSALTRWLWGKHVEVPSYNLVRWAFLRALAMVYFFAFLSVWTQITGLVGHNGILPADQYMAAAKQHCDEQGMALERFHLLPTLCWFDASDTSLQIQCAAGTVVSVALFFGLAPAPCLAVLWILFLSLVTIGRVFLAFQWDNLLLEAGLLAIFLAPLQFLPRPSRETPPSRLFIWLLRLLLFKLMFSSGCVKLLSGDPNWRNLTALTYHYQTQPLPPWTAWYAHQWPAWFQKFSCTGLFVIELGAPVLIFLPRRARILGAGFLAMLQALILITGNYCYFNWLSLALCLVCLDDFFLAKWLPLKLAQRFSPASSLVGNKAPWRWPFPLLAVVAALLLAVTGLIQLYTLRIHWPILKPLEWVYRQLSPFRCVNDYGLFAVMTTERNEIILEGSNDGTNWLCYEFKYKPGDINRRPAFVAPMQPRLDWQMWFASLGAYRQNPWLANTSARLLQGSPEVLALLAKNPFPDHPPKYIRAEFFNYRFTTPAERQATGAWWHREPMGDYMPVLSLKE